MLRIRVPEELVATGCDPRNFFDLNGQDYKIVSDSDPVDILCVMSWSTAHVSLELKKRYAHTVSVEIDIWHAFENHIPHVNRFCQDAGLPYANNHYLITCITQDLSVSSPNIIYTDFCFNKAKAGYTHFPYHPSCATAWYNGPYTYIMPSLKNRSHNKVFIAPNRIDTAREDHRVKSRFAIHQLIKSGHSALGYASDGSNYLHNNSIYTTINDINILRSKPVPRFVSYGSGIHNLYYKDTFVSIYGETVEYGTSQLVTEKTYDPLANGHFILPFSSPYFLNMVRARQFVLPDFIDYSYDVIEDFDLRLNAYIREAQRLLTIPVAQWRQLYEKNIELLHHNQLVFHRRDYQRIDLSKLLGNQS